MAHTQIQFPFSIRCEWSEADLSSGISIRAMNADDRLQLLGISSVAFDENGRLKSYVATGADPFDVIGPDLDHYAHLYSSNYVATVPSRQAAKSLNLAFKLLARSCTSLWIGTSSDSKLIGHQSHFVGPPCYFGSEPLSLDAVGVQELSELLCAFRALENDKKFAVMADVFMYAMSVAPREESRCIELSVVLEMLLLPAASSELSYRFALRLAKLMSKKLGEPSHDWFEKGRKMYKTRSCLVHSGEDKNLARNAQLIQETSRRLLAMYVREPTLFEESYLDSLCLAA